MKNCSDWKRDIAGESESAQLAEHLQACEGCRDFAQELEKNRLALREIVVHAAAFDAVRRHVRGEIEGQRRRTMWWTWSGAAAVACLAVLCLLYFVPRLQNPGAPIPMVARKDPPRIEQTPRPERQVFARRGVPNRVAQDVAKASLAQKSEPLVVKMLTNDPDVIIIWLVDQKGDAL
jgi:hypothetical protein